MTYTCYDNAIPASQTTSTSIIPANLSRCKSILSVPVSQDRNDNVLNSNALCGQFLDATQYEYQINNKLVPVAPENMQFKGYTKAYWDKMGFKN